MTARRRLLSWALAVGAGALLALAWVDPTPAGAFAALALGASALLLS